MSKSLMAKVRPADWLTMAEEMSKGMRAVVLGWRVQRNCYPEEALVEAGLFFEYAEMPLSKRHGEYSAVALAVHRIAREVLKIAVPDNCNTEDTLSRLATFVRTLD